MTLISVLNRVLVKSLNNSFRTQISRTNDVILRQLKWNGISLEKKSVWMTSGLRSPSWGPPKPIIDRKDIEFRVLNSLLKHDKLDINSLTLDSNFNSDLGLDSLDVVECVVHLEDEFGLEISDVDSERLLTARAVVDFLCLHFESEVDQNERPDIEFKEGMTDGRPIN